MLTYTDYFLEVQKEGWDLEAEEVTMDVYLDKVLALMPRIAPEPIDARISYNHVIHEGVKDGIAIEWNDKTLSWSEPNRWARIAVEECHFSHTDDGYCFMYNLAGVVGAKLVTPPGFYRAVWFTATTLSEYLHQLLAEELKVNAAA